MCTPPGSGFQIVILNPSGSVSAKSRIPHSWLVGSVSSVPPAALMRSATATSLRTGPVGSVRPTLVVPKAQYNHTPSLTVAQGPPLRLDPGR
jgi:hypothetical protein